MEFKLGDKVFWEGIKGVCTVVAVDSHEYTDYSYAIRSGSGSVGTIDSFSSDWRDLIDSGRIKVLDSKEDGHFTWAFNGDLKLAYIKNSKLARKLYPNHEIVDKNWIIPHETKL